MTKQSGKYTAAQEELSKVMSNQQTVSVPKLGRLLNTLNISFQPGESTESVEIAYLKAEIKKRDKKLAIMGQKNKKLSERQYPFNKNIREQAQ